ncbi:DUF2178 domain-containing protein [Schleiferilactobacillus shenzhenensis]|uniref:Uncharacterized protein n=1 Tax=Schleiferilactobacillus shenzhenensis LY-73 TaxID=1231336 RepID=U4THM0_9LACO|nr:DUF2178 domain-containing protein [Schleiferilactobacillus shenzhenensis]ERL63654.1 hypothetical protein L248_2483 [Schleiferilactobacillus shenzhenensis LY-73]
MMSTVMIVLLVIGGGMALVGLVWLIAALLRKRRWQQPVLVFTVGALVALLTFTGLGALVTDERAQSVAEKTSAQAAADASASTSAAASRRAESQADIQSSRAAADQAASQSAADASSVAAASASAAASSSRSAASAASASSAAASRSSQEAASASSASSRSQEQAVVGDTRTHQYYPATAVPDTVPASARASFSDAQAAASAGFSAATGQ